jgi:hypothetical protein
MLGFVHHANIPENAVRSLSNVAIVTEPFLDDRLQDFLGVSDRRLGGIHSSGNGSGGESSDDGIRDNVRCHGGGCNCATANRKTETKSPVNRRGIRTSTPDYFRSLGGIGAHIEWSA